MRASDETEIEKHSLCVFACARVRPGLLFGARTGDSDAHPNACASGEIECDERTRTTKVWSYRDTSQETIANQCGHATMRRCNVLALPKQAEIAAVLDGTVQKVRIE